MHLFRLPFPLKNVILILFLPLFSTCVNEFPLTIEGDGTNFLVVNAILNASTQPDIEDLTIRIIRSDSKKGQTPLQIPILKAEPTLVINNNENVQFVETESGYYKLPSVNVFKTGSSYKLRFKVNNQQYESTAEIMPDAVPIAKVYSELKVKPIAARTYEVYVDVNDVPQKRNFYKWSLIQWEEQKYCLFCYDINRSVVCRPDLFGSLGGERIVRNNFCQSDCYDILRQYPNNSISDIFFDGKVLLKKPVADIPYNFSGGTLVEVRQSSLTPQYYDFTELLRSQTTNAGGLVDVPPALLVGNIRNLSRPEEQVVGYFSVTNTTTQRHWISRKEAAAFLAPFSSLNPPLSAPVPPPREWNPVPCEESNTRTQVKPQGWGG